MLIAANLLLSLTIVPIRFAAGIGATVLALLVLMVACLFIFAGFFEVVKGRRPPGLLGRRYLNRGRDVTVDWSPDKWRVNGFQVIVMGVGLVIAAMTIAFYGVVWIYLSRT